MPEKVIASSRRNPCPICNRAKDGDCRLLEDGLILCHRNTEHRPGAVVRGHDGQSRWAFTGVTADQRCGIFKIDEPLPEPPSRLPAPIAPPTEPIWYYSATQRTQRFLTEGKKVVMPQHLSGSRWITKAGPDAWPFYGKLPEAPGTVIEVEGEKCADILKELGYAAITHPGHNFKAEANQARYGNIKDRVKLVVYIADNDEPGRKKAIQCATDATAAGVPFITLHAEHLWPGIKEKGSVDDVPAEEIIPAITAALARPQPKPNDAPAIDQARLRLQQYISEGLSGSALATKVIELSTEYDCQTAPLFRLAESIQVEDDAAIAADADYQLIKHQAELHKARQEFKLEYILPDAACEPLRYFSSTLQSDDLSTAMIFLTCMTGALKAGTRIWGDQMSFAERPQIWLGLVGKSGLGKSPAAKRLGINNVRSVVRHYQARNVERHDAWEAENAGIQKKDRTPEPAPFVFRIGSYTKAAIVKQFMANEAERLGMLIFNDELKSLFTSLNQFQGDGKGSEEEQLLELYDNDGDSEIRAGEGYRHYEEAQLSIIGGIQPAVYSQLAAAGDANGLFARLLLLPLPRQYSGDDEPEYASMQLSTEMDRALNDIILKASLLQPAPYHLTPDARAAHKVMRREAFKAADDSPIPTHSNIYGKRAGYILRIAGAIHLAKIACGEIPHGADIPLDTLLVAQALVHHLQEYSLTAQTQAAQHSAGVVPDMMRRLHAYAMDKPTSAGRFRNILTPKQRKENSLHTVNAYIQKLVDAGYAVWQGSPSGNGGRCFLSVGQLPG